MWGYRSARKWCSVLSQFVVLIFLVLLPAATGATTCTGDTQHSECSGTTTDLSSQTSPQTCAESWAKCKICCEAKATSGCCMYDRSHHICKFGTGAFSSVPSSAFGAANCYKPTPAP
eukprot:Sspe_Gene.119822::Locus_116792_Transcript_1_2_Confidence_0.667_Length_411::g.119822::m.119822